MWPFPRVIAHRGGGTLAPENTIAGLRCGLEHGYRAAEFDIMLSADGVPVLMHDPAFGRTVPGIGNVSETSAQLLATMDAGSWFGPKFAGDPGKQAPSTMPGARMVGRVNDQELADLYSAAGCFVFPSRYEGFGLPCLEAMACGCPVAAYRNSSLPEVVDDAGRLVDDGDAEALGTAAAEMAAEPDRWRVAGIDHAKRFSWRKTARLTIAAYEAVLR